jgi:hypothetical protein
MSKYRVEYVEINPSGEVVEVEAATAADAIRSAPNIVGHRIVSAEQVRGEDDDTHIEDIGYAELVETCESCGYRIVDGDQYFTTGDDVTLCEKCMVEQEGSRR